MGLQLTEVSADEEASLVTHGLALSDADRVRSMPVSVGRGPSRDAPMLPCPGVFASSDLCFCPAPDLPMEPAAQDLPAQRGRKQPSYTGTQLQDHATGG